MSVKFESERLYFRLLKADDLDDVMEFWGNEEVMKYCLGAGTRENEAKCIQTYQSIQEEKGFSVYAVVLKEDSKVIGACGFNPTKQESEGELIYHYAKKYWGKGYATEAARACIEYAPKLGIKRITASIDPRHIVSKKVLEKVGFKYTHTQWCELTKQNEPYFEIVL